MSGPTSRQAPAVVPAVPSTPAQHGRHDRILEAATEMLTAGGPDALQMKELSQRADVSLATLYRYFPAKDHVLLAITLHRYERALTRVQAEPPSPGTVRQRVTTHLMREFRAEQREPRLTGALYAAISETIRDYREVIERIERAHLRGSPTSRRGGGTLSPGSQAALPVVADVFTAATRRWLACVSIACPGPQRDPDRLLPARPARRGTRRRRPGGREKPSRSTRLARAGRQPGLRMTTGIWRVVFCSYSAKPGLVSFCRAQMRSRSSPWATRAVSRTVWSPISASTSGCATRL